MRRDTMIHLLPILYLIGLSATSFTLGILVHKEFTIRREDSLIRFCNTLMKRNTELGNQLRRARFHASQRDDANWWKGQP